MINKAKMEFFTSPGVQLTISIILALIPVFIWLSFLFKKGENAKKKLIIIFLFGAFSVLPILAIQYLWLLAPQLNIYEFLQHSVNNVHLGFLLTFIAVGIFEEIAKFVSLTHLKWAKVKIQSINEAVRYILVIALGYAFSENIIYFWSIIQTGQLADLFSAFVLRSLFTTAAHMLFSGIVAYSYAMGKFGNPILEVHKWTGKKHSFLNKVQSKLGLKEQSLFSFNKSFFGLLIAMGLHALFNFTLQVHFLSYAFLIVIIGFLIVIYLSKKRISYLVFTEDELSRPSTIGKKEENVIIELLGMWYNEGKYNEVVDICNRLEKRDPDNMVVQLFKAKAIDRKKIKRVKRAIRLLFSEEEYDIKAEEMSLFERLKDNQDKSNKINTNK